MNILVVGLGALGTVYSCLLKRQGHQVTALVRPGVEETLRNQGVVVSGIWGQHQVKLDGIVSDPVELAGQSFDLILVSVKSYDTYQVVAQLKSCVTPQSYVVLLQNGLGNFEAAAQSIPPEQIILGRVIFGSETEAVGVAKVTVIADDVVIGSPENLVEQPLLEELAQVFHKAGIPTRASEEVMKYIWGKIIYNSALNPLGAIFEVNYGKLVENPYSKGLIDDIIEEIFTLLKAMGQETLWPDAKDYKETFYGKLIPTTAAHHASMLQDMRRGRKPEIDALNGAVVQLGAEYGLTLPVNEMITKLVKTKEQFNLN